MSAAAQTVERFSLHAKNGDEIVFELTCDPYNGGVNWLVEWRDVPMGGGHAADHAEAKAIFVDHWRSL